MWSKLVRRLFLLLLRLNWTLTKMDVLWLKMLRLDYLTQMESNPWSWLITEWDISNDCTAIPSTNRCHWMNETMSPYWSVPRVHEPIDKESNWSAHVSNRSMNAYNNVPYSHFQPRPTTKWNCRHTDRSNDHLNGEAIRLEMRKRPSRWTHFHWRPVWWCVSVLDTVGMCRDGAEDGDARAGHRALAKLRSIHWISFRCNDLSDWEYFSSEMCPMDNWSVDDDELDTRTSLIVHSDRQRQLEHGWSMSIGQWLALKLFGRTWWIHAAWMTVMFSILTLTGKWR